MFFGCILLPSFNSLAVWRRRHFASKLAQRQGRGQPGLHCSPGTAFPLSIIHQSSARSILILGGICLDASSGSWHARNSSSTIVHPPHPHWVTDWLPRACSCRSAGALGVLAAKLRLGRRWQTRVVILFSVAVCIGVAVRDFTTCAGSTAHHGYATETGAPLARPTSVLRRVRVEKP